MKIIIAIDNFKVGGAERVASLIANELCKNNEVHAIIFEEEIRYPIDSRVILHVVSFSGIGRLKRMYKRIKEYVKIIKEVNPDAIYAFAYVSIYAAMGKILSRNKYLKLICSERTNPAVEPTSIALRALRNWAYSQGDTLVCQTPSVVDYFKDKKLSVSYKVIPNLVKEELPVWKETGSKTFITACRLAKQKNLPLMIKAFKKFIDNNKGYKLEIYGDGPEMDNLITLVHDLNIVDYVRFFPFDVDIHTKMATSLAYISSSDYEGISNSMLEALAIGLPTICTDCPVGGARMFIENGVNGILVPVNDEVALFKGMEKIVKRNIDLKQMSNQAQNIRQDLSPNKIVGKWLSLVH